ncbi:hypothetical protein [Nocardia transvalensis]|uniref:hypothetical protein n=1 Tax=Nocardia transvalensis TaxID=37333 RepID=UPI0018955502|nr:hypothetical protein [Nocardia transvalensis]MBF6331062.1 hypothetical protein [Nocardia transvalensis]
MFEDWAEGKRRLTDTEARLITVLDELKLTDLSTRQPRDLWVMAEAGAMVYLRSALGIAIPVSNRRRDSGTISLP